MQCFDFLQPYEQTKLKPNSCLCCFLGYGIEYKGCRCHDHFSCKLHISQLVIFLENMHFSNLFKCHLPFTSPLFKMLMLAFFLKIVPLLEKLFLPLCPSSISQHIGHEDSHSSYISSCPTRVRASPLSVLLLLQLCSYYTL